MFIDTLRVRRTPGALRCASRLNRDTPIGTIASVTYRSIPFIPTVTLTLAVAVHADELAELRDEIDAVGCEIAELRGDGDAHWLDERREAQVRALIDETLADADARTSYQDGPLYAGWDDGFFLASPDDGFRMNVGGLVQLRFAANAADDPVGQSGDHAEGFTVHRARLKLDGHIADPRVQYFLQLDTDRSSGNVRLLDAHLTYDFDDTTALRGGRFVAPLLREQMAGAPASLAADRSHVNTLFTANRVEGVMLIHTREDVRLQAAVHDGSRSGNPGGVGNDFFEDDAVVAATARGDWKIAGPWSEFGDFAAFEGEDASAFVGAAVLGQLGKGDAGDVVVWTVDGSIEIDRLNLFAAGVGQHTFTDGGEDNHRYGLLLQAGYMVVPDRLQPFVRVERVWLDDLPDVTLLTGGANLYLRGNTARLTLDATWALDPITVPDGGLSLVRDAGDGQVVGRAQVQLVF